MGLLGWSCASVFRRSPPPDPVQLKAAAATFPGEGRGEFRLDLQVPNPKRSPGKLTGIDWEVWLNNQWFASGTGILDQDIPPSGGVVHITLPVAFGRLPTSSAPVSLRFLVRGNLTARFGGSEDQLAFSGLTTVQATNAPVIENAAVE
jgi:hypothetical protein